MCSLLAVPPCKGGSFPLLGSDGEKFEWLVGNMIVYATTSSMCGRIMIASETAKEAAVWTERFLGCPLKKNNRTGNRYRLGKPGLSAVISVAERDAVDIGRTCFFRSYLRTEAVVDGRRRSVLQQRARLIKTRFMLNGKDGCEECGSITETLEFLKPDWGIEKGSVSTFLQQPATWKKAERMASICRLLCSTCSLHGRSTKKRPLPEENAPREEEDETEEPNSEST